MDRTHYDVPSLSGVDSFQVGDGVLACTAEGWNGNVLKGLLIDMEPEKRVIKIQSPDDARTIALKFSQIKRLKIDTPSKGKPVDFSPTQLDNAASSFVIHLKDGALFSGLAYGYRKLGYGVWIFPKKLFDDEPDRFFIPRAAVSKLVLNDRDNDTLTAGPDSVSFDDTIIAELQTMTPDAVVASAPVMIENMEQLVTALENQTRLKPVPIGEALLGLGKITPDQLTLALNHQKKKNSLPLGQMLVEMGLITAADLQTALARKMGYPFIDLSKFPIDVGALRQVPLAMAAKLKVLPLAELRSAIVVAMHDPLQFKVIEEVEFTTQKKVIPVVTTAADLVARISKTYREIGLIDPGQVASLEVASGPASLQDAFQLAAELTGQGSDHQEDDRQIEQSDNTLVKLINSMIIEAYQQGASDIHIEPYPGKGKVSIRFRVDGEMRSYLELPSSYRSAMVARIKIMCDLDISERRKPQDGKINFAKYGGLGIELRVATIPTVNGLEDVVMRLLSSSKPVPLESINLSDHNLAELGRMVERPYGLVLCVGPTGSGKTTTLHSALQRINKPNRKIWTAEDPVEITQHGLRQIQVNAKIGWTFASALRSLLRADPDVIMVGEIRDGETAEIAVEASLTGHLVLSTLHTNSAAETITRLIDLGVDPFSFADSLQGVLAQRLVRRLCSACATTDTLPDARLAEMMADYQAVLPPEHTLLDTDLLRHHWIKTYGQNGHIKAHHANGCEKCGQTGYKGRLAIHELLSATPTVRRLIQARARADEVQAEALREGMRTLRQDGIEKVLAGLTSLAEVRSTANA